MIDPTDQIDSIDGDWLIDAEFMPMIRRVARLDSTVLVRFRAQNGIQTAFAVLPSGALASRSVAVGGTRRFDATFAAEDLTASTDAQLSPIRRDEAWRGALPPTRGWTVLERVPEPVIRDLVAQGALAHVDAAQLGLGARAAQDLLDVAVLTVHADAFAAVGARVTNRVLSAVTAMGFLPSEGHVSVAINGRWTRVAARYGSVFSEDPRAGLGLL